MDNISAPQFAERLGIFNVRDFGAAGNGTSDDTSAVAAAIDAAQSGGGGIVWVPPGKYLISSALTVDASYVGIAGAGPNISTIDLAATNVSGIAFTGTPGAYIQSNFCKDLTIAAHGAGNGAVAGNTSNVGVRLYYTAVCKLENLQINGFYTGVSYRRANNTISDHVVASFTSNSIATRPGATQFSIDGNPGTVTAGIVTTSEIARQPRAPQPVTVNSTEGVRPGCYALIGSELVSIVSVERGSSVTAVFREDHPSGSAIDFGLQYDYGGNASSVWRDCYASSAPVGGYKNVNPGSVGFSVFGANCADLFFDACATSYSCYGWYVSFAQALYNSDSNEDVHLTNCTVDQYTYTGITVTGISGGRPPDTLSAVNITGCWTLPYQGVGAAVGQTGVSLANTRGVLIRDVQLVSNSTTYTPIGIAASGSRNILIRDCMGTNLSTHVRFDGCTDSSITGCRFSNQAGLVAEKGVWITGSDPGSSRLLVARNTFDGHLAVGCWLDASTKDTIVDTNTFAAHNLIPVPIRNLVSGTTANLGVRTTNNVNFNPIGQIAAPEFPDSGNAYYNNAGVDLAVNVFTPAGVRVHAISLGELQTGLSIAGGGQLSLALPAGQSIGFTYSGGTPSWTLTGN